MALLVTGSIVCIMTILWFTLFVMPQVIEQDNLGGDNDEE